MTKRWLTAAGMFLTAMGQSLAQLQEGQLWMRISAGACAAAGGVLLYLSPPKKEPAE